MSRPAVYLETSAVGSAIFDGQVDDHRVLHRAMATSDLVASKLTLAEGERALHQKVAAGTLPPLQAQQRLRNLRAILARAYQMDIGAEVLARVGQPFSREPLRTLDAIHLATMLQWQGASHQELQVFARDGRLCAAAEAHGFRII